MTASEGTPTPFDRWQAVLEVLLLAGIFSSFVAFLPFHLRGITEKALLARVDLLAAMLLAEAAISLLLILVLLRVHREGWAMLGAKPEGLRVNIAVGIAIVPLLFLANAILSTALRHLAPALYSDSNPLVESIRTPRDLALFSVVAIVAGGVKEELQRAFIVERFRRYLGGPWLGVALWSVVFGLGHHVQGVQGALAAGLYGVVFGAVYLVRDSIVAPMVAHALYNVTALLGYWVTRPVAGT